MGKPKLTIAFSDGNIARDLGNIDGIAALIGTGQVAGNRGKVIIVHSLAEAETAGITAADEPYAHRQVKEFYEELGANQELYILLLADTVTMEDMLATDDTAAGKLITAAGGKIGYLGVFRTPDPTYDPGDEFIDADAVAAFAQAKTFVEFHHDKLNFFRVLVEGRVADEDSNVIFEPKAQDNPYAGMVLGGTQNDLSASVGMALGRKVKYAAHIKLGKVANGALTANEIYIGTKKLSEQDAIVMGAVAETKATATTTLTALGANGQAIWLWAVEPNNFWTYLGLYTKVSGDATLDACATALAAAVNAGTATHGYSAAAVGAVVTVTAKAGNGASMNGQSLIVNYQGTWVATKTAFAGGADAIAAGTFQTDHYHDKGFISFVAYPNKAGFFFGVDNMGTDGDYRYLAHGAVVDAAARVAADVYIDQLEGEVATKEDGTITDEDASHLEDILEQQILNTLGERISDVDVVVDRTVNIINTSTTKIKVRVRPVGYNTFIEVEVGLTAGN